MERMLRDFNNALILRLRMPISDDLNPRSLVTKITKSGPLFIFFILFYFFYFASGKGLWPECLARVPGLVSITWQVDCKCARRAQPCTATPATARLSIHQTVLLHTLACSSHSRIAHLHLICLYAGMSM